MRRLPRRTDRRARAGHLLAMLLGLAAPLPGSLPIRAESPAAPAMVQVVVDNAKLIRLPEKTQTVIVGNPSIADVTVQKSGVVVLTGKSFGTTNLIALDGGGVMIAESLIRVEAPQGSNATVTVQRGPEQRESYSCTPNCQPTAQLGDSTKWFSDVNDRTDKRRALASGGGGGGGGGGTSGPAAGAGAVASGLR